MILKCFLLLLTLFTFSTPAQIKESRKFSKVPTQLRARLIERLNLYFEYERTKQYDKLYDLVSEHALGLADKPSRENFIKMNQEMDAKGSGFEPLKIKVVSVAFEADSSDNTHQIYSVLLEMRSRYASRVIDEQR